MVTYLMPPSLPESDELLNAWKALSDPSRRGLRDLLRDGPGPRRRGAGTKNFVGWNGGRGRGYARWSAVAGGGSARVTVARTDEKLVWGGNHCGCGGKE